jgi:hypothetical protein
MSLVCETLRESSHRRGGERIWLIVAVASLLEPALPATKMRNLFQASTSRRIIIIIISGGIAAAAPVKARCERAASARSVQGQGARVPQKN